MDERSNPALYERGLKNWIFILLTSSWSKKKTNVELVSKRDVSRRECWEKNSPDLPYQASVAHLLQQFQLDENLVLHIKKYEPTNCENQLSREKISMPPLHSNIKLVTKWKNVMDTDSVI